MPHQPIITMNSAVLLLTLAHVGGAEGYCNQCLSVCCQNSSKPMNISTLKILPADFKSYSTLILCDKMFRLKFAAFYKNTNIFAEFIVSMNITRGSYLGFHEGLFPGGRGGKLCIICTMCMWSIR